jgi:hypothetical protein
MYHFRLAMDDAPIRGHKFTTHVEEKWTYNFLRQR